MAACTAGGAGQLHSPEVGEKPNQPLKTFKFPQREFGKTGAQKRSFQHQWFQRWSWLHYVEDGDLAFCFTCVKAYQQRHLDTNSLLEKAFVSSGFRNWKDATSKFAKHEGSRCHADAVLKLVSVPSSTRDIGELFSSQLARDRHNARKCFLKILSNVRFLSRQGLPFRGDGDESDSNFMRLLELRGEDSPLLKDWIARKTDKYVSGEMQNEMVKTMALQVLRSIADCLRQTPFFTVMVDETVDVANVEQVVLCLRWVDGHFIVHEDFVGLHKVDSTGAQMIFNVIVDVLRRLNLPFAKIRGQCYDGAATMAGSKSGVASRVLAEESRAVFTHCYGHSLNLACGDTIKRSKLMKDALDTTHEITKLIKKSPARDATFRRLKEELASDCPGIRVLCPTRWTVRAEALQSILDNYSVLCELWEESIEKVHDTEMKARIQGVAAQMLKFDFFFGVSLGKLILRHSDNLSRTLQRHDMSAAEGQSVTSMVLATLEGLRTDEMFNLFFQCVKASARDLDVAEPNLPRRRKVPRRLDDGHGPAAFPTSIEEHYRPVYFEALDLITSCIKDRFDQPGYKTYSELETLILNAASGKPYDKELKSVLDFYGTDLDPLLLPTHLEIFRQSFASAEDVSLSAVIEYFQKCSAPVLELMSQVAVLIKLILVMPASNASSERAFSSVRRIKSYLRSTMLQQRFNHLMLLHVHNDHTDGLKLVDIANEFITGSEHRQHVFGMKFKDSDLAL